jgi:hypothetical protein
LDIYITTSQAPLTDGDIAETSFIYHAASKHGALVLGLEPRYYGASRPTVGFDTPGEVKLLSSEQALADVNNFLVFIKKYVRRQTVKSCAPF